jgi:hypothetical protein
VNRTMNLTLGVLICAVVFVMTQTREASAQAYFRDDFDGTEFKPNWILPPPEHWNYTIGGGELTVNELKWPSQPFGNNSALVQTPLPTFVGDWAMTVGIRWDPKTVSGTRILKINTGAGVLFVFDNGLGNALLEVTYNGQAKFFEVSSLGDLELGLKRSGTELSLLYQGNVLGSVPDPIGEPVKFLQMEFQVTHPWTMTPMHVNYIQVVPSPSVFVLLAGGAVLVPTRRRS